MPRVCIALTRYGLLERPAAAFAFIASIRFLASAMAAFVALCEEAAPSSCFGSGVDAAGCAGAAGIGAAAAPAPALPRCMAASLAWILAFAAAMASWACGERVSAIEQWI